MHMKAADQLTPKRVDVVDMHIEPGASHPASLQVDRPHLVCVES